jgi:hypothetical protein
MAETALHNGKDLWGQPFVETSIESAPVKLLQEQANALTRRTDGRIVGDVFTSVDKGTFWASLYARVPFLRDYQHKLISVAHPVVVADPMNPFPLTVMDTQSGEQAEVNDMGAFERWLEHVLSSKDVHNVVDTLLGYSPSRRTS